jgi:hypothetical protein
MAPTTTEYTPLMPRLLCKFFKKPQIPYKTTNKFAMATAALSTVGAAGFYWQYVYCCQYLELLCELEYIVVDAD